MRMTFHEFYNEFHWSCFSGGKPALTLADEVRTVILAYKDYRRCFGLTNKKSNASVIRALEAEIAYHLGVCELAEIVEDKIRMLSHWESFQNNWIRLLEILHEEDVSRSKKARRGLPSRFRAGFHLCIKRLLSPAETPKPKPTPQCLALILRAEKATLIYL